MHFIRRHFLRITAFQILYSSRQWHHQNITPIRELPSEFPIVGNWKQTRTNFSLFTSKRGLSIAQQFEGTYRDAHIGELDSICNELQIERAKLTPQRPQSESDDLLTPAALVSAWKGGCGQVIVWQYDMRPSHIRFGATLTFNPIPLNLLAAVMTQLNSLGNLSIQVDW